VPEAARPGRGTPSKEDTLTWRARIYRILEIPWVYNLSQAVLNPGAKRIEKQVFSRLSIEPHGLILDVGCGPRPSAPVGAARAVGVDINPECARQYRGGRIDTDPDLPKTHRGPRTRFSYVASADRLPFADGIFDEARCQRLFHHLTPAQVIGCVREMVRCVRPGGRVVLMDAVVPIRAWRRPVAWVLTCLDRGEWMRSEKQLLELVFTACPGPWAQQSYTSNYLGVEAVTLVLVKSAALLRSA
jgi:SAM-dependent methyltransferase